MKKSEWDMILAVYLSFEPVKPGTNMRELAENVTEIFVSKGWLPPARTEHGITKNDWEPEDE